MGVVCLEILITSEVYFPTHLPYQSLTAVTLSVLKADSVDVPCVLGELLWTFGFSCASCVLDFFLNDCKLWPEILLPQVIVWLDNFIRTSYPSPLVLISIVLSNFLQSGWEVSRNRDGQIRRVLSDESDENKEERLSTIKEWSHSMPCKYIPIAYACKKL